MTNMIIEETKIYQLYIIEMEKKTDDRGFFARTWCKHEFEKIGMNIEIVQSNLVFNKTKGTFRGFHYQKEPFSENKIITCIQGSIIDLIIDLRPASETYLQWKSFSISSNNKQIIFIPKGIAHGYQTLDDNTILLYQSTEFYYPKAELGIRFNDPFFNIKLPLPISNISAKDKSWEDYKKKSIT
jgi:dTDP-4-dehydrorhamnose 3,5-epimerase